MSFFRKFRSLLGGIFGPVPKAPRKGGEPRPQGARPDAGPPRESKSRQEGRRRDNRQQGDRRQQGEKRPQERRQGERRSEHEQKQAAPRQPRAPRQPAEQQRPRQEQQQPPQPKQHPQPPAQHPPKHVAAEPWDPSAFAVPPAEGKTRFHDLGLPDEVVHAIADLNFQYCTPVQAEILPKSLEGLDATGQAQTGTGKTAAFLITILNHILRNPLPHKRAVGTPRALVLAPTRELVLQIEKDAHHLGKYCGVNVFSILGGMDYERQKKKLADAPVDIMVATPGRLLDFKGQGRLHLGQVEILVIDEADRMLDMGFIPDIRRIVESTPPKARRQTMFFSATMTPDVRRLAASWTKDPAVVEIEPTEVAVASVDQKIYITTTDEKFTVLYNMITQQNLERVIVFTNRRDEAQRVQERLSRLGINCGLLSGDVEQRKRIATLERLRSGQIRVLVATDVAARGLHIEGVSHVVNYNLPLDAEDYVHRIGRTGRAGALGISVSFACEEDGVQIPAIEQFIGRKLEYSHPEESWFQPLPPESATPAPGERTEGEQEAERRNSANRRRRRGGRGRGRGRSGRRPGEGEAPITVPEH